MVLIKLVNRSIKLRCGNIHVIGTMFYLYSCANTFRQTVNVDSGLVAGGYQAVGRVDGEHSELEARLAASASTSTGSASCSSNLLPVKR